MTMLMSGAGMRASQWSVARAQFALDNFGVLECGPGTFPLGTTSLELNGETRIKGVGPGRTIFTYDGNGEAIIVNSDSSASTQVMLEDFEIFGSGVGGTATGIRVGRETGSPQSGQLYAHNVEVRAFGVGIELGAAISCEFNYVRSHLNGINVRDRTDVASLANTFNSCKIRSATTVGMHIRNSVNLSLNECIFELNGEEAVLIDNDDSTTRVQGVYLNRCYFESNNTTRVASGNAEVRVNAGGTGTSRRVVLMDTTWSTVDASDFHLHVGANEEVYWIRDRSAAPIQVDHESGTPNRVGTPDRIIGRTYNVGGQFVKYNTLDVNDTTPTPQFGVINITANSSPTTITEFGNFLIEDGEWFILHIVDANTSITHSTGGGNKAPRLAGGVDYNSIPINTRMMFVLEGNEWLEVFRDEGALGVHS